MSDKDNLSYKIIENHPADSRVKICEDNIFQTLSSRMGTGGGNVPMVLEEKETTREQYNECWEEGIYQAYDCSKCPYREDCHKWDDNGEYDNAIVRRLTPLECERLQGYPDGWTDIGEWTDSKGKKHKDSDSPRYKALGNSIALPFWEWMAKRICSQYERPATMGSLFDGIGGFPLVFSRSGCIPVWASEIEEFPIAVTKLRFKEDRLKCGDD